MEEHALYHALNFVPHIKCKYKSDFHQQQFTCELADELHDKICCKTTTLPEVDGSFVPVTRDTRTMPEPGLKHGQQKMIDTVQSKAGPWDISCVVK